MTDTHAGAAYACNTKPSEGAMHLDPEQRAVLELAAGGLTSDEVAARLGQPPEAARRRIAGAIAALGAESRLEAVAIAARLGLIDPPGDWPRSR